MNPTDKVSSNNTIKWYFKEAKKRETDKICVLQEENPIYYDNVGVFFQPISDEGLYQTSFEEAFIRQNYSNELVNDVLESMKPKVYKSIVGGAGNKMYSNNKICAYHWQRSLSESKGDFASNILYMILVNEDDESIELPVMPNYIAAALDYIKKGLKGKNKC